MRSDEGFFYRRQLSKQAIVVLISIRAQDPYEAALVRERLTQDGINEELERQGLPPISLSGASMSTSNLITILWIGGGVLLLLIALVCIFVLLYCRRRRLVRGSQSAGTSSSTLYASGGYEFSMLSIRTQASKLT